MLSLVSCSAPAEPWTMRLAVDPLAPPNPAGSASEVAPVSMPSIQSVPLASCADTADGFAGWLVAFRQHALDTGISPRAVLALDDVAYDPRVIELDRSQRAFKLTFEQFAARHLTKSLVARGKQQRKTHAALLARIEEQFGVPPAVLVALWGLETSYGDNTGSMSAIQSLATLAHDCRRAERFRGELLSALRIIDRGDLSPGAMIGAWAGELGQTQFLPSSYETYATDFDGDGRADLIHSRADALASTAHYLQGHGWRAGEGFAEGSPNYLVLAEWNKSEVYRRTIVAFATRLDAR